MTDGSNWESLGLRRFILVPNDCGISPLLQIEPLWGMEVQLELLNIKLKEAQTKRDLPYTLFLLRCKRHLERRIRREKGEPLFDKPTAKPIKNQRRRLK